MTGARMSLDFEGTEIPIREGDSVLTAVLRSGLRPWGGALCADGDCPHCLVTVDGIPYERACLRRAAPGISVDRHPRDGNPPLPAAPRTGEVGFEYVHCHTVVIGQGRSGRAAAAAARDRGRRVVALDRRAGSYAVGVYPGPEVAARTPRGMARIFCEEVVVAAGRLEVQPVCPGNGLAGILTMRAARRLAAAGVRLGSVVSVGDPPDGVEHRRARGRLVRFEGERAPSGRW